MFNLLMFRQSPVLYLTRELGVQPATIGLIYALGGVGGLLGAVAAERLNGFIGMGRTIVISQLFHGLCLTALPMVALLGGNLAISLIACVHFVWGLTSTLYAVPALSLRQAITPNHSQGQRSRKHASIDFWYFPARIFDRWLAWRMDWIVAYTTFSRNGVNPEQSVVTLLSPLPAVRDTKTLSKDLLVTEG